MSRQQSMWNRILTDKVILLKVNGQRIDNIKASVQSGTIFIDDVSLAIVEGDQFLRLLPNGIEEKYTVVDTGFKSGLGGIKSHYQTKVRKETGLPEKPGSPTQTIGMYVHGNVNNSNIQSIGVANEEVSQIINDPVLLQKQVETAITKLIEVVKSDLNSNELVDYINTTQELKQLLLSSQLPDNPSLFKRLITSLSLLDSTNGTLDLVYKLWPYILPLIALGSEILRQGRIGV